MSGSRSPSVCPDVPAAQAQRFTFTVARCRRCGHQWPAHLDCCRDCAAALGEPRKVSGLRVCPPLSRPTTDCGLAVVLALELASCRVLDSREWAQRSWAAVEEQIADAAYVRPGPEGTIVAAWRLRDDALERVADRALEARDLIARDTELRGGVCIGVVHSVGGCGEVERLAERLALVAAPSQVLIGGEAARQLEGTFELRPVGAVPRWQMSVPDTCRSLRGRIPAPVLPSAVAGEPPDYVVGRSEPLRRVASVLCSAAAGRRRVLLVSAPAGGGKSCLLRRALVDADLNVAFAGGVAFPPLGGRALDPINALLIELGNDDTAVEVPESLGDRLGAAVTGSARARPSAVVVDDIHWAAPQALVALVGAIRASARDAPLAWVLSARSSALSSLAELDELVDARVRLAPLSPPDREELVARRLGSVSGELCAHVAKTRQRGNPLYLEHLAALIAERGHDRDLPGTLHEAVLARLGALAHRARRLARNSYMIGDREQQLREIEKELGDWLDRLETSDLADLQTIGQYLARLSGVDAELVIARAVLRMPVSSNRRVAQGVRRLAAASTDALLDYLATVASRGNPVGAGYEAQSAAARAERELRLADAERLIAFACEHGESQAALQSRLGDLALALGRPDEAVAAYDSAIEAGGETVELIHRAARAHATAGRTPQAEARLEECCRGRSVDAEQRYAAQLDLARLRGAQPPPPRPGCVLLQRRQSVRVRAWATPDNGTAARAAVGLLVLDADAIACQAELVDTAALARLAEIEVGGLQEAATRAADALGNPSAQRLLRSHDLQTARRTFLHWQA